MKRSAIIGSARTILIVWIVLVCALSIASLASAEDSSTLLERARQFIMEERYGEAEQAAMSVLMQEPDNREAILLLGIALGRKGSNRQAASLLKRALYMDPLDAEVNLELGRNFIDRGIPAEAEDYLERAIELSEGQSHTITQSASEYLSKLRSSQTAKHDKLFTATALMGIQHDSNVPAISGDVIPAGKQEDLRITLKLNMGYRAYDTKMTGLWAGYYFYHSTHDTLSDYDLDMHSLTLKGTARRDSGAFAELRYIFEQSIIDGYDHSTTQAISPSFVLPLPDDSAAIITYRYRDTDANDVPISPSNSGRDGHSHLIGLTGVKRFAEDVRARVVFIYEDRDAELPEYAFEGHKLSADASFDLSGKLSASLYGEGGVRVYSGPGAGRVDQKFTTSASLEYKFKPMLGIVMSLSHVWNESDMQVYEYERALMSLMLKARY